MTKIWLQKAYSIKENNQQTNSMSFVTYVITAEY